MRAVVNVVEREPVDPVKLIAGHVTISHKIRRHAEVLVETDFFTVGRFELTKNRAGLWPSHLN